MKKYNENTPKFINDDETYEDLLDRRGIDVIEQNETKFFKRSALAVPRRVIEHVWSKGDKLYKLAHKYYGDKEMWWIISTWNAKPTEAHFYYGEVLEIPFPPESIYRDLS